jgi:hypothetical protein
VLKPLRKMEKKFESKIHWVLYIEHSIFIE